MALTLFKRRDNGVTVLILQTTIRLGKFCLLRQNVLQPFQLRKPLRSNSFFAHSTSSAISSLIKSIKYVNMYIDVNIIELELIRN